MPFTDTHHSYGSYSSKKPRMVDMVAVCAAQQQIADAMMEACKTGGVIPGESSGMLFTSLDKVAVNLVQRYSNVRKDFCESVNSMAHIAALLKASGGVIPYTIDPDPRNQGLEPLVSMFSASRMRMARIMDHDLGLISIPHIQAFMEKLEQATERAMPAGRPAGS
jgi:hypothetical protein